MSEVFSLLQRFSDALAAAEVRRQERVKKEEAATAASKHRRMQTEPAPASSLASVLASASVQQAMKAHADQLKNATWDDRGERHAPSFLHTSIAPRLHRDVAPLCNA